MILNLILTLTMYPTMLIIFVMMKHAADPHDGMIFGVHLPGDVQESEAVRTLLRQCRKRMRLFFLLIALFPVCIWFFPHETVQFSLWMLWFFAALTIPAVPYIQANKACMVLKEASEKSAKALTPSDPAEGDVPYAEPSIVHMVKAGAFLIPILLSLFAVLVILAVKPLFGFSSIQMDMLEPYQICALMFAVLTPLFFLLARSMDRMPADIICKDSAVNIACSRAKKTIWKKFWLLLTWANTICVFLIAAGGLFLPYPFRLFIASVVLLSAVCLGSMIWASRSLRKLEQYYQPHKEALFDPSDDRYWIFGMFYKNPHDSRVMVNKRFGIGSTVNLSTRAGKATIWIAVLSLVWVPFLCIYLIVEDFTPMHLLTRENKVVCMHLHESYVISYDEITDAALLGELPTPRSKVSGTATDQMEKGRFSNREIGKYYSFVDPSNDLFIRIDTDDRIYILCGDTHEETMQVYEEICAEAGREAGIE